MRAARRPSPVALARLPALGPRPAAPAGVVAAAAIEDLGVRERPPDVEPHIAHRPAKASARRALLRAVAQVRFRRLHLEAVGPQSAQHGRGAGWRNGSAALP
eukprot:7384229-Prymnesium_polylepis.2